VTDVAHQLSLEVRDRGEHTAGDDIALDLGEPQLDLVEPPGVARREVQANVRMRRKEILTRALLCAERFVGDHADLFPTRLIGDDVGEERDELRRGMSRRRLAKPLAGLGVEGGVQGQGAVPVVLKAVPFRTPRRQRQHRLMPSCAPSLRVLQWVESTGLRLTLHSRMRGSTAG
jgi:hypothetical protein